MSKQKSTMVTDLTNGSVTKLLLRFAFPLFVSNALQAVYNIVDMVVVGQVASIYSLPVEPFIVALAMVYPLPTHLIVRPLDVSIRNPPSLRVPVTSALVIYNL